MAVITCLSASAFTVVVDHPEAVTVKTVDNVTYKTTVLNLNPGANEVTPSVDGQLSVKVNSPWVIDSAVKSSGASMTYFMSQYSDTYTTSSTETYTITTHNPEAVEPEPPTPSTYLTLNIDHPEALSAFVLYDGDSTKTTLSLTEGENQIETAKGGTLSITKVSPWLIESAEGLQQNPITGGYSLVFSAGATGTYTIVTKEPEPSSFVLNVDHPEALNAFVLYDGDSTKTTLTLVEGDNKVYTAKGGTLSITKVSPWIIESAEGLQQNPITGGYSLVFSAGATGTYTIVTKEPEPDPTYFTLNIDHPEAITAQVSYNNQPAQTLSLVAGANQVESTQAGLLLVKAVDPWEIESAEGMTLNPFAGGYSKDFVAGFEGTFTVTTKDTTPQGITLVVDNPDAITVEVGGLYGGAAPRMVDLVEGNNLIELPSSYSYIQINNVDPYLITSIVKNGSSNETVSQGKSCRLTFWDQSIVATYEITTKNMDEARTASFTLIADDPSLFTAQLTGTYTTLELVEGENTVMYDPEVEKGLEISAKNSTTKPIYKVTLDGEEVTKGYSSYNVTLSQDCVVEVTAIIPPVPVTVTFNYATEESFGSISSVKVDGETVEDFDGHTVNMKAGQQITINGSSMYKYNSFKVDGNTQYITGSYPYTGLVLNDVVVAVDASKYASFNITVKVTDPSQLKLYRGYSYNNDRIELTSTENTIEVFENNTTISWEKEAGCEILSVKVNGEPFSGYGQNTRVEEGTVLEFETKAIELDKTAVLWVDDAAKAESFSLTASDNTVIFGGSIAAATGYNEFVFNSGWNDFTLSFTGTDLVNKVYVNGEAVEEEEGVRMLNLADNAVVKVFLAEEPVSCDVKFEVADDVKDLTVTHDVILVDNDIETISKGYSCFNGTEFKVAEGEVKLQVSVNGENITAEEGNFVFVVTQPETVVKVSENIGDSVEAITDAAAAPTAVFNLHGVKVSDTTDNLPAGLYIVAGKKVVVK